jgi:hypothetical protein
MYTGSFNVQKLRSLLMESIHIFMFRMILKTISDYFDKLHHLSVLCNGNDVVDFGFPRRRLCSVVVDYTA